MGGTHEASSVGTPMAVPTFPTCAGNLTRPVPWGPGRSGVLFIASCPATLDLPWPIGPPAPDGELENDIGWPWALPQSQHRSHRPQPTAGVGTPSTDSTSTRGSRLPPRSAPTPRRGWNNPGHGL